MVNLAPPTDPAIAEIYEAYGDRLEYLTHIEKMQLIGVLATFLAAIADEDEDYSLQDANNDSPLQSTGDIDHVLAILQQEINEETLKRFMQALLSEMADSPVVCNTDLFDAAFTSLMEDGMDEATAKAAARAAASNHVALPRTPAQQAAIDAALQDFQGIYMPRDRMAAMLAPAEA